MQPRDRLAGMLRRDFMRLGASAYRLRNLVECRLDKLKNARRVATCYDRTAESFLDLPLALPCANMT